VAIFVFSDFWGVRYPFFSKWRTCIRAWLVDLWLCKIFRKVIHKFVSYRLITEICIWRFMELWHAIPDVLGRQLSEPLWITGRPAGLSRVNGARHSIAKIWNSTFRQRHSSVIYQLISYLARVISLGRSPALPNLVQIRWEVKIPSGGNTYGSCGFSVVVLLFFNRATAHTREPIFEHNSSKDAVWCKEDSFGDEKCAVVKFWGVLL